MLAYKLYQAFFSKVCKVFSERNDTEGHTSKSKRITTFN